MKRIFSSKLITYKSCKVENLYCGTFKSSTIFGIYPASSIYSLAPVSKDKFFNKVKDNYNKIWLLQEKNLFNLLINPSST